MMQAGPELLSRSACVREHDPLAYLSLCVMNAIFVVVADVLSNKPPQVGFAQHDNVIEQLSATAANPALGHAVLPGTCNRPFESAHCPGIPVYSHLS